MGVMFLRFWNNEKKTREKFVSLSGSEWLVTGDRAHRDAEGYFFYDSRDDDIINMGGYRIGPAPIEMAVLKHEKVLTCAAVATDDAVKGEAIKVFVVLKDGESASDLENLKKEICDLVRESEGHIYVPKYVEVIDALPMTVTSKVQRNVLRQRERDAQQREQEHFVGLL